MDLIDDDQSGNTPEFSVSDLSGAVKRMIEGEFGFVRVRGEVGRVSRPRSGHVYLDLKDDRAVISGVMWKGVAARLRTQPEEGMEVVATGRMTTFPGQSKYQIVLEDIRPAGMGALMAMLEKRKAALAAEGLFAPERKRELPFLPEVIGVVTSPSGAVIRDILHRLRDRFPRKVLIWPVRVQGEGCAGEVARAIEGFNAMAPGSALPRPDLLIVARGGGSVEDLWGFNEEVVVRAAAASRIPLISAVGHETDTTLIDFASDRRAPTPTAAAELAVPVRLDLLRRVSETGARMARAVTQRVETRAQRLRDLSRAMPRASGLIEAPRQRLDLTGERLPVALTRLVDRRRLSLADAAGSLRPVLLRRGISAETARLQDRSARLQPALRRLMETRAKALEARVSGLNTRRVAREIDLQKERVAQMDRRLKEAQSGRIAVAKRQVEGLERLRETLGYRATLMRGYAVVRGDGHVVTRKSQAETASALEIEFADGRLSMGGKTRDDAPKSATKPKPRSKPKSKPKPPEQGSLF